MKDKKFPPAQSIGAQIRACRRARGLTLATVARRAGTSAPTLHRYESGWERFELPTLRRIASALDARLDVRLIPSPDRSAVALPPSAADLAKLLRPLFWDHDLRAGDLRRHPKWVLRRVLAFGDRAQVAAARRYFGDDAVREAAEHRGSDRRTRNYWRLILGERS